MNENPGETPNPLSSNNAAPATGPTLETKSAPAPTPAQASVQTTPTQTTQVESLDPTGRPMEKAAPEQATTEPKKKTGLIIGIIIAAVVIIGGIIAAVALLPNMNKGDAVAAAMQKIMSGNAPENVAIDGDINILINQEGTPIKRLNINLDSDIMTGSMINTSSAVLTFTTYDDKDYSVEFDEVYAANGDLYFKVEGVTDVLEDSNLINLLMSGEAAEVVDCEGEEADCVSDKTTEVAVNPASSFIDAFEVVDGVWLKISTDEMNTLKDNFTSGNSTISCVTDMVSSLNKNSNSTAELYNKFPFVTSTTENVILPSKNGTVYLVSLDSKNFTNYVNTITNSNVASDLYTCLGYEDNVSLDEEDVAELVAKMPKVYAEVNGNNDFTRLYLETDINEGTATATIDLGFDYPQNVNASEPVEYTDFSEVIKQIMGGMFEMPSTESEVVEIDN